MTALDLTMRDRETRVAVSRAFFRHTGSSYDRVVDATTLGLDRVWKRLLLAEVPRTAKRVLDLGCGTGIVLRALRRRCPGASLVGVDMTAGYLAVARRRFAHDDAVTLIQANAEEMELVGRFDAVVSSYVPKYVDPDTLLDRIEPHVGPGTVLAVHDFGHPSSRVVAPLWRGWMRALKHLGPKLWPEWGAVFDENLERLIRRSRWQSRYAGALRRHGWRHVERRALTWQMAYLVTAAR